MAGYNTVIPGVFRNSYGTHLLDHLAADGAGLAGGQVTVVTVGQIDANFRSGLHLELISASLAWGTLMWLLLELLAILFFSLIRKDREIFPWRRHIAWG